MPPGTSAAIDELFQLPLDEFTAARNALARGAGKAGAEIRALTKPPLAAWAVNQLYWQDRHYYDDLIRAAIEMRKTHKAVIEGRRGDLRTAGREHDVALEAAVKRTLALLEASGNPVTDATRQSIINTLRALPASDPPGRLTRTLAPGGFEMLAGVSAAPAPKGKRAASSTGAASSTEAAGAAGRKERSVTDRDAETRREQKAAAERAFRDADQRARQAEFEAARAKREAARAERRLEQARQAFEDARTELEAAERDADRALKATAAADQRCEAARGSLEQARASRLP